MYPTDGPLTDEEYETHVVPLAIENWTDHHGRYPWSEADHADMLTWAVALREQYDNAPEEIYWRY